MGCAWWGVRVVGPLAGEAEGFAEFLAGQGYAVGSVRLQVHPVAQLSRWLAAEGLDAAGLTELEAGRFIAARRARVRRLFRSRRALDPLMSYLTLSEVLAPSVAEPAGPVEEIIGRYRRYLLLERGLTQGTAHVYVDDSGIRLGSTGWTARLSRRFDCSRPATASSG
jgi:integrase/recombinase XerD